MTTIKDRLRGDRPREKLQTKGVAALSDLELLMAIIGSGNAKADVTRIAKNVLKLIQRHGHDIPPQCLYDTSGIGSAKASEILAAFELAHRYLINSDRPIIDTPAKAVEQLSDIRDKKQEYFVCLTLDGANRLIAKRIITIGTLTSSLVHPREVFADAITDRTASIIVAHNHPSGNLEASTADTDVTGRLKSTGKLLGIQLVDHIILTKEGYSSILQ